MYGLFYFITNWDQKICFSCILNFQFIEDSFITHLTNNAGNVVSLRYFNLPFAAFMIWPVFFFRNMNTDLTAFLVCFQTNHSTSVIYVFILWKDFILLRPNMIFFTFGTRRSAFTQIQISRYRKLKFLKSFVRKFI